MTARKYSSVAAEAVLTGSILAAATSMTVDTTSGWPVSYPFTLILEADTVNEELVTVTNVSTLTITITRGEDGTTAVDHNSGATVKHGVSARDFSEPQVHINSVSEVHGTGSGSSVVGTTDAQTLTNKILTTPTIASFINATHTHLNAAGGGTLTTAAISDIATALLTTIPALPRGVVTSVSTTAGPTTISSTWTRVTPGGGASIATISAALVSGRRYRVRVRFPSVYTLDLSGAEVAVTRGTAAGDSALLTGSTFTLLDVGNVTNSKNASGGNQSGQNVTLDADFVAGATGTFNFEVSARYLGGGGGGAGGTLVEVPPGPSDPAGGYSCKFILEDIGV